MHFLYHYCEINYQNDALQLNVRTLQKYILLSPKFQFNLVQ
jgi:hypothetical protein